jgi:hypothetical protein
MRDYVLLSSAWDGVFSRFWDRLGSLSYAEPLSFAVSPTCATSGGDP